MKRFISLSFMALTVGLSGCTTLEGVWTDIKTGKRSETADIVEAADVKELEADMLAAQAIWPNDQIQESLPGAQTIQIASIRSEPLQLRGRYAFDLDKPKHESAAEALRAAKMGPGEADFLGAIQLYEFKRGAIYQVLGAPEKVTDISLEPGEELISASAGDTVRWMVGDTTSGTGANEQVHILIKPLAEGISTNLVILTSRRTYYVELEAKAGSYMPAIAWHYEKGFAAAQIPQTTATIQYAALGETARMDNRGTVIDQDLEALNFSYKINGDRPAWRPIRAFDDGMKVFIQFPQTITKSEAPPLFVETESGENTLVNYRVKGRYYVVDRLFERGELRLGEKKQKVVKIIRGDAS